MIGYSKGGSGYCLIKVDNLYRVDEKINGQAIVIDNSFRPEHRVRTWGKIIQLPFIMGNTPIIQKSNGYPGYGAIRMAEGEMSAPAESFYTPGSVNQYKMMSDIVQDLAIDDLIYFKWRVIYSLKNRIAEEVGKDKKKSWIYKVPYDHIFCKVKDDKITMVGSFVLIDPIFETWDEILRPTYTQFKDKHGNWIPKPKSEWLQVKVAPSKLDKTGIVAHVGAPLRGETCELKPGQKVLFRPNLKNLVTIEGRKYFVMLQDHVTCTIEE